MKPLEQKSGDQIFKSKALELLTKSNPFIHIVTYGSLIAFFLWMNHLPSQKTMLVYLSGLLFWTLKEYLLHRFFFHISFPRLQYAIHGIHHAFPRDKQRVLMPPVPGILISAILYALWFLFIGAYANAFMAGIITGYMVYSSIHYSIHTYKPIKGLKFLWAHHLKHHNPKYEDRAFGVSTPFWDWVFRTMP
jgi:sterol desaturase/sphingolipid hydroxylase (fatty acid hydroxylase superfamily)